MVSFKLFKLAILQDGKLEQLERDHKQLSQAGQILQAVYDILPEKQLQEDPKTTLQHWQKTLQAYKEYSPHIANAIELLTSALVRSSMALAM